MTALNGRVALVTGAGSGIGRAIALAYAREGARVIVSDLNADGGSETVRELQATGAEAQFVAADVARPPDGRALVDAAVRAWGRLDIACNNAGIGGDQARTADYPIEGWQRVIDINLSGVFYGMRAQIPQMLKNGGGAIVNMASILAVVGFPTAVAYTAAKHGVIGLTQTASAYHRGETA